MSKENEIIYVKDEMGRAEGAYKQINEKTIVIIDPDTHKELVKISKTEGEFDIEAIDSRTKLSAIQRCCKGCDLTGGGSWCYLKCGMTNGGEGW